MANQHRVELARVLHVEPVPEVKRTVSLLEKETRRRFAEWICSFVVVQDSFEALDMLAHKKFDCIIVDERVDFNAYDAIQIIRTLMPSIPILIILHSLDLTVALNESEAVGCTHVLRHDFSIDQYCTALQHMLHIKHQFPSKPCLNRFPWDNSSSGACVDSKDEDTDSSSCHATTTSSAASDDGPRIDTTLFAEAIQYFGGMPHSGHNLGDAFNQAMQNFNARQNQK